MKKQDLVYGVVEKWCSETNTFVFPFGEATITLEDVIVLGGYSLVAVCGLLTAVASPVAEHRL
jgi:hypothetical protein